MYEAVIMEEFKKVPVFSLADVNQIIKNRIYAKKFLKRMLMEKKILRIKRDCYTLYNDPFLVSTFILRPSYVSSVSALSFYGLVTQIPNEIFCFTNRRAQKFDFIMKINFIHTNFFFGFEPKEYDNFKIPIADVEKAIIDTVGLFPLTIVEEAVPEINRKKMIDYLKKVRKSCVIKRIGLFLERNGVDVYEELKNYINKKYIPFDPKKRGIGKKNKKWFVIENG